MGKVIMSGIVPLLTKPSTGILASDLAVGSVVKLMEGGTAVDYLVVNQGVPGNSSLYDSSCNGTWLLRKDIYSIRQWNSSSINTYADSIINTWLNEDFFNGLGTIEQSTIKQVKIPYCVGEGTGNVNDGTNGLNTKIFLLGGYEVGWTTYEDDNFPIDGAKLSYFESGIGSSALNKRIAYLNGAALRWWLRSPYSRYEGNVWVVDTDGRYESGGYGVTQSYGIRPVLIIPSNAKFNKTTMILKGAA